MISATTFRKWSLQSLKSGTFDRRRLLNRIVASHGSFRSILNNITQCHETDCLPINHIVRSSSKASNVGNNNTHRFNSSVASISEDPVEKLTMDDSTVVDFKDASLNKNEFSDNLLNKIPKAEISRLRHMRNVGVFAHVDAGKTTVTERMLALAGIVARAGSVDDGNTVTDYLPAERERGITIQSAAIRFPWAFHNAQAGDLANDRVSIALIDTPGHVDFSVEVNRSVAVLDGAVLVVDAAAGVQAQTRTVWRAMTRTTRNILQTGDIHEHSHEPLPCVAVINKMDKIGADFHSAVQSLREKLPGANPMPIQLPIFKSMSSRKHVSADPSENILLGLAAAYKSSAFSENFMGILDLIHMRVVVWPDRQGSKCDVSVVENCIPTVIPLWTEDHQLLFPDCHMTKVAVSARAELVAAMAEVDEEIEDLYLNEQEPTTGDLRQAIRRATTSHQILPVVAAAAVKGKGIEPCLDAIADYLPSPIDRMPPSLSSLGGNKELVNSSPPCPVGEEFEVELGHCFHPTLVALAFKVLHMKGRGGSGDGRVVFVRVYSGRIRSGDTVQVVRPTTPGEKAQPPRKERVGGMLELTHFCNLENGEALSGDVCALVGLKSVVTGDTLMIAPTKGRKQKTGSMQYAYCAGVTSPKPVLTVKLEADTLGEQAQLSEALSLLTVEDPSLVVEENDSGTLLSGLGELHIEVTLDRIRREHGLHILTGSPSVAYRETVTSSFDTGGLVNFDRKIGDSRLQASIHLKLEPLHEETDDETCQVLADPVVTLSQGVLEYLNVQDFDGSLEELELRSDVVRSLTEGCRCALKRGQTGYAMANVKCHVIAIDSEDGLAGMLAMPGSLRAAAAHVIQILMQDGSSCGMLEPRMSIELSVPNEMVGSVLSDLTSRRGTIDEVILGDASSADKTALVRGEVPLVETLGYASQLRTLTGGEASFTSEYKGYSLCSSRSMLTTRRHS